MKVTTRKPTILTDLPLELLWMISEYLLPVDLACLALCNHHMLSSLAGTAFRNFSNGRTGTPTDDARIELLSRLSCNLPQCYLYFLCLRLHTWKGIGPPSLRRTNALSCAYALDLKDRYLKARLPFWHWPSYTLYKFHFVYLQLAMRRFYSGLEFGIPVEALLYTEIGRCPLTLNAPPLFRLPITRVIEEYPEQYFMKALFCADARICSEPPGLCLRTQNVVLVQRQNLPRIWLCHGALEICNHIHSYKSGFIDIFTSHVNRYCSATTTSPVEPAEQGSCGKCNTSWELKIRTLDKNYATVTITRWMDLGPGLAPDDAQWRRCVDDSVAWISLAPHEIVDSRLRFERDSIQASSSNALSPDALYFRNVSLLQETKHQTVMNREYGYILHGEAKPRKGSSRCIIL